MYTDATIPFFEINTEVKRGAQVNTLGDRILYLLREGGRRDRGEHYNQRELLEWLTGEQVAPNGKKYNISISLSPINRIIRDEMQRPPLDVLQAIGEIFNCSLDWLVLGREADTEAHVAYFSEDASAIAHIADQLGEADRKMLLMLGNHLAQLDKAARARNAELAKIMANHTSDLPANVRDRMQSLLSYRGSPPRNDTTATVN